MNFMCGKRLHRQPTRIKLKKFRNKRVDFQLYSMMSSQRQYIFHKKIVKSLSKLTLRGNSLVL